MLSPQQHLLWSNQALQWHQQCPCACHYDARLCHHLLITEISLHKVKSSPFVPQVIIRVHLPLHQPCISFISLSSCHSWSLLLRPSSLLNLLIHNNPNSSQMQEELLLQSLDGSEQKRRGAKQMERKVSLLKKKV